MPSNARTSACAERALIRAEKLMEKEQEALEKKKAKMKHDNFLHQRWKMAALREFTPKQMKEHGIIIINYPEDPNATPGPPNYMRPTAASARRSVHSVAKGGRRTRKRRNGKKKTMRKGGRMRKSGMRRHRRY
jgi:hypothetical protein